MISIKRRIEGICINCYHGQTIEHYNNSIETYCSQMPDAKQITKPVKFCSEFRKRNEPSDYEMEKIAWILTTDKGGKITGFKPPPRRSKHDVIIIYRIVSSRIIQPLTSNRGN